MVPREPRKKGKKQSARMEMPPAAPVISDDEWDSFYRRSVLLLPGVLEAPPAHGSDLTPSLAGGASAAQAPIDGALGEKALAPDAGESPWPGWMPEEEAEQEETAPAALTDQEWRERFFQRGKLTGLLEGDDLLILTAPDVAGGVTSLRLRGPSLRTVAAAALQQDPAGFDWRDHDDLVLLGIVLDWYVRGISLESRPAAMRDAIWDMAERYSGLIERLAALLPSR